MNNDKLIPDHFLKIGTLDMHTGGEPLRIITDGLPDIPGNSILEKRKYFKKNLDHIRRGIIFEPRGHRDMYGAVITEPTSPGSDFGVIFLHNEGYSTMCGHAVIALTRWAIESGMVKGEKVIMDVPSGRIEAVGQIANGLVVRSRFRNVPSYVLLEDGEINLEGHGRVKFDIAFGGAYYAIIEAELLGISLMGSAATGIIEKASEIKKMINDQVRITHPFEPDLGFLYGVIFTGPPSDKENHSRNVCVFADGELDRSATGSGVSARAALHYHRGELQPGQILTIESIIGTTMQVEVTGEVPFGPYRAVIPEVSGNAHYTGRSEFYFDPEDPLRYGFLIP